MAMPDHQERYPRGEDRYRRDRGQAAVRHAERRAERRLGPCTGAAPERRSEIAQMGVEAHRRNRVN